MNTDKLLRELCRQVGDYQPLDWLREYVDASVYCSFTSFGKPRGEVQTKEVGPWFAFVVHIAYEGTTMDPSTDRADGDPYSAQTRYDWIGPRSTLSSKISRRKVLDEWATYKSWYSREFTAPGLRGVHRGSWVTGIDEDGTVSIREVDVGWFQDESPESKTTERKITLDLPSG